MNAFSRDYENGDRLCLFVYLEVRTLYDSNLYLDTVIMKKEEDNEIQIYINKKEMLYSHQNMARAINSFLPYLTNVDLTELGQDILDLMSHREAKEAESRVEVEKHSWPYPDTIKQ